MMKKIGIVLISLGCLFLCSGCGAAPTENTKTDSTAESHLSQESESVMQDYAYDETEFAKEYKNALERLENGEKPADTAPADPSESGFAVVSLDEETYGISRYAILPVLERELSDEELLQLAEAMNEMPVEELLDSKNSWNGDECYSEWGGNYRSIQQNRPLSRKEYVMKTLLEPEVLYGNRTGGDEPAIPQVVTIPREDPVSLVILPEGDMTEEQMVRYAEIINDGLDTKTYLPTEDEIQYDEIGTYLESAIARYQLGEGPLPKYSAYLSPSAGGLRTESEEYWMISLCYETGFQYSLALKAVGGELASWTKLPEGYCTADPFPSWDDADETGNFTVEDFREAAENYVNQVSPDGDEIVECEVPEQGQMAVLGLQRQVDITLAGGDQYSVSVKESDLTIAGLSIKSGDTE